VAALLLLGGGLAARAQEAPAPAADAGQPQAASAPAADAGQTKAEPQTKAQAQTQQDLTPPGESGDSQDSADDERAVERAIENVVTEDAGPDAGSPDHPAEVNAVPATAANAVAQHASHLEGLALWRKAKLTGTGDALGYFADSPDGKRVRIWSSRRCRSRWPS